MAELDLREQLTRIDNMIAETRKLVAESDEKTAATIKIYAETRKLNVDRWLTPVIVVFGGVGSLIAGFAAVWRLLTG